MCFDACRLHFASVAAMQQLPRVETAHGWVWVRVVDVYDGDTLTVALVHGGALRRRRCRCVGYDAPELRTRDAAQKERAVAAREHLRSLLPTGVFRARVHGLDKYGRLLLDCQHGGAPVSQLMIGAGHGYAYDGGTKRADGAR